MKQYTAPVMSCIQLDNEISLILESDPPVGPGEANASTIVPEHFNNNAFKDYSI